jgi:hypothetical protein
MLIDKLSRRRTAGEYQSSKGYLRRQVWTNPIAVANTGIAAAITLTAAVQTRLLNTYTFTVTSAAATIGAVYKEASKGTLFTVVATVSGSTSLVLTTVAAASGIVAGSTVGSLTKVSGTGDATIAFSTHAAVVAITQPDFARTIRVKASAAGDNSLVFTIKGTNIRGTAISEDVTLTAYGTAQDTLTAFKTITSLVLPIESGGSNVSFGPGAQLGLDRIVSEDSTLNAAYDTVIEGTRAVITDATLIEGNTILFATSLANGHVFAASYIATEITADNHTTA